ncbi:MAG: hypothetical protein QXY26_10485 [Ignisphaera sp.]
MRRKCYIGPLQEYEYVEKQHGLGLGGIESTDYYKVAITAIKKYINRMMKEGEKDPKLLKELYDKLMELNSKIFTTLLELGRMMKKQDIKQRK